MLQIRENVTAWLCMRMLFVTQLPQTCYVYIYLLFFVLLTDSNFLNGFSNGFASHFTHGQPRGFGDNYLSADFGHLDNDAEFDSVDFMPQFDFDGFFKKVDVDERSG